MPGRGRRSEEGKEGGRAREGPLGAVAGEGSGPGARPLREALRACAPPTPRGRPQRPRPAAAPGPARPGRTKPRPSERRLPPGSARRCRPAARAAGRCVPRRPIHPVLINELGRRRVTEEALFLFSFTFVRLGLRLQMAASGAALSARRVFCRV